VKFVTRLSLVQVFQNSKTATGSYEFQDTASNKRSNSLIIAYTPWSILIPVDRHHFTLLDSESYNAPVAAGLSSMSVGIDYVINEEDAEEVEDFFQKPIKEKPEMNQQFILDIDLDDI
jgi:hypothetical protein